MPTQKGVRAAARLARPGGLAPAAALVLVLSLAACGARQTPAPNPMNTTTAAELFERGLRARDTGDTARAEQYIVAALERGYPADPGAVTLLEVCIESDRYDTALHYGRTFLVDRPDDWRLRYLVATLHSALGEHRRALEQAEQVIELQPDFAPAHMLVARVADGGLERPRLARRSWRRYLRLDPTGPHAADARRYLRRRRGGRP